MLLCFIIRSSCSFLRSPQLLLAAEIAAIYHHMSVCPFLRVVWHGPNGCKITVQ